MTTGILHPEYADIAPSLDFFIVYAKLPKLAQYDFRRGFFTGSGCTRATDANVHKWLMEMDDQLEIENVPSCLFRVFSVFFTLGYMFGTSLLPEEKKRLNPEYKESLR